MMWTIKKILNTKLCWIFFVLLVYYFNSYVIAPGKSYVNRLPSILLAWIWTKVKVNFGIKEQRHYLNPKQKRIKKKNQWNVIIIIQMIRNNKNGSNKYICIILISYCLHLLNSNNKLTDQSIGRRTSVHISLNKRQINNKTVTIYHLML